MMYAFVNTCTCIKNTYNSFYDAAITDLVGPFSRVCSLKRTLGDLIKVTFFLV